MRNERQSIFAVEIIMRCIQLKPIRCTALCCFRTHAANSCHRWLSRPLKWLRVSFWSGALCTAITSREFYFTSGKYNGSKWMWSRSIVMVVYGSGSKPFVFVGFPLWLWSTNSAIINTNKTLLPDSRVCMVLLSLRPNSRVWACLRERMWTTLKQELQAWIAHWMIFSFVETTAD